MTTGTVWKIHEITYTYGETSVDQQVTDGFITRNSDATIGLPTYNPPGDVWYNFNGTRLSLQQEEFGI